ncbi:hypothetical protein D1872_274200 [compost metagenome]
MPVGLKNRVGVQEENIVAFGDAQRAIDGYGTSERKIMLQNFDGYAFSDFLLQFFQMLQDGRTRAIVNEDDFAGRANRPKQRIGEEVQNVIVLVNWHDNGIKHGIPPVG